MRVRGYFIVYHETAPHRALPLVAGAVTKEHPLDWLERSQELLSEGKSMAILWWTPLSGSPKQWLRWQEAHPS